MGEVEVEEVDLVAVDQEVGEVVDLEEVVVVQEVVEADQVDLSHLTTVHLEVEMEEVVVDQGVVEVEAVDLVEAEADLVHPILVGFQVPLEGKVVRAEAGLVPNHREVGQTLEDSQVHQGDPAAVLQALAAILVASAPALAGVPTVEAV